MARDVTMNRCLFDPLDRFDHYRGRLLCRLGLHGKSCRGRADHVRRVDGRVVVPPTHRVLERLGW